MQNRWGNKNEVLSNILHKYNEWSFILTFIFNLHLKNIFTLKKSSTFANLLMEKPGIDLLWQKCEKNTRRKKKFQEKNQHLYLKFYSGTVFSFCLCKSTSSFLRKQNIDPKWVIPINWWIKKINELLQTVPLTITWCIVPFKNWKSWTFC